MLSMKADRTDRSRRAGVSSLEFARALIDVLATQSHALIGSVYKPIKPNIIGLQSQAIQLVLIYP